MKIMGINVDEVAIATGIYDQFDSQEVACCAFGMLPANKMETLSKLLDEKFEDIARDQCEKLLGHRPEGSMANQKKKNQFVREATRVICSAIYGVASDRGRMVV